MKTVRCIYRLAVQISAEHKGLKPWCDKNCGHTLDGHECFAKLKSVGIDPRPEMRTKK